MKEKQTRKIFDISIENIFYLSMISSVMGFLCRELADIINSPMLNEVGYYVLFTFPLVFVLFLCLITIAFGYELLMGDRLNVININEIRARCPVCSVQYLGFRTCSDEKTIVLMCEECGLVWRVTDEINSDVAIQPLGSNALVWEGGPSVSDSPSHWSSDEELELAELADRSWGGRMVQTHDVKINLVAPQDG